MGFLSSAVDAVLEASVAGSFTRVGSAARRRLEHWSHATKRLDGKIVVISGATSGLGLAAAKQFAKLGATVEIVARNPTKAEATCAAIRAETANEHVTFVDGELGNLASVRTAAATLLARHSALHVLIHNAGALDATYGTSPQGIEQTVASHVVGPFLFTQLLRSALKAGAPSRVIWMSSGGMYSEPLRVDRLEMKPDRYDGTTAYARAKRAQVTLSELMATEFAADGITVQAMHPGWVDTPGLARSLPAFKKIVGPLLRTADEEAESLVWLATADEPAHSTGKFWLDRVPRETHRTAATRKADTNEERARLWQWVTQRSQSSEPAARNSQG